MPPAQVADVRGGCLCGAVAFTLTPPTDFVAHCQSCRRSHGAAVVTWTSVPNERFELRAGSESLAWYRSLEWIEWGFCRACGSSMLDRAPSAHVSYEERVPWLSFPDGLPKHLGKTDETIPE
jgi:hypothetical protein